jgi:two-component sensor histidine kinase
MLYDKAWFYRDKGVIDSSFKYFNLAKESAILHKDSIIAAKSLINMAIISTNQGDYFGSQEISLSAIAYLNPLLPKEKEILSSNYNNLGKASHLLKKYDKGEEYYLKAIALTQNDASRVIYLNNLANNYSHQKQFGKALAYYEQLMAMEAVKSNKTDYARTLSNYAKTKWLKNRQFNAKPELLQALQIRLKEDDKWGLNASYAHLADYYFRTNPDSARYFAEKMYDVAKGLNSADDQLEALQKLISLSNVPLKQVYFERYLLLNDSLQTARNAAKNQFALIRYETEKHKADYLKAQAESQRRKNRILQLIAISALLFAALVAGVFYYRKRKKRLEQEKELEVKNTELKYVRKVHDRVANGIYHVMSIVEHQREVDKQTVMKGLGLVYNISRDISYEETSSDNEHFGKQLAEMLHAYRNEKIIVSVLGNKHFPWASVAKRVKDELYCVLQELMTNMRKHSGATEVEIKFEHEKEQIKISYTDDGVGLPKQTTFKNGLNNTETRIKSISGTITFDHNLENGLRIKILAPFS